MTSQDFMAAILRKQLAQRGMTIDVRTSKAIVAAQVAGTAAISAVVSETLSAPPALSIEPLTDA
jgi:hypothetical protein